MEANALSRSTIHVESLRKCDRRQVAETGLRALPIIKDFEVLAHGESGPLPRRESLMIDQFAL